MATLVSDARVDVDDVKDIIDTELTDAQINAFINAANAIVDNQLADTGQPAATLALIEMWLAAHLLATRDQRVARETVADADYEYQGKTGMGLEATFYGQQALILDTSGRLEKGAAKRATFRVWSESD